MPHKRRSYGYIDEEIEVEEDVRSDMPVSREPKTTYRREKRENGSSPWMRYLWIGVSFPFILLYRLGRRGWQMWKRRPKMSASGAKNFRRKLWKVTLTIGIIGFLSLAIFTISVSRDLRNIDPNQLTNREVAQSTKIYDRTGEHLLYEIYADEKRTIIEYDKIPKNLINGVIATEDKSFFEHHGIRPLSIVRAAFYGVIRLEKPRGTSTLTQQLVKNVILTNEGSLTRKIKEAILSIRLEQKYTKEQILQIYFNEIPYGSTNYGIEAAAQSYYGKSVTELNLQEAATLAGIPQRPSAFLQNRELLKQRRDFVLRRMQEEGYITVEEKEAAQAEPMTLQEKFDNNIDAPHFVMYVKGQLENAYGINEVNTGGYKVITTLDWEKQALAEKALANGVDTLFAEANANNGSIVALDPRTGEVLAMVGSRDFFSVEINGQYNVATQGIGRQPGSSFKPIVYAAAFEKGYTPDTVLFDVVTNFSPTYSPRNYDGKEYGLVTMRKALQGSLNIPAVKTLYLVGEKNAISFAERMGYTTLSNGDFGLSLVLGGGEVHLLEHTAAYGIFANNGIRHNTNSILRVEDGRGDILFEKKPDKGERVLDEKVAATISNVLSDDAARAYIFGAGSMLTIAGRPVAVKTGTTNAYVDAWTVGYTPSLVAGVWIGNSEGVSKPMNRGFGGNRLAGTVWNQFMKEALAETPVEQFPPLPPNDAEKAVLRGSVEGITLDIDRVTGKRATSSTPPEYIVKRTYIPPHDILHYVTKSDPRGAAPEDPSQDPQYNIWEGAIQDWIRRNQEANPDWNVSFEEPPTEFDDAHTFELIPNLTVLSPAPGSTLTSRFIEVAINATAPRGVARVIYRIDDRYVGTIESAPFALQHFAADLDNGEHKLFIVVEDDLGNRRQEEIPFTLEAGIEAAYVSWTTPSQVLSREDFPRLFSMTPIRLDDMQKIIISTEREDGSSRGVIGEITDFSNLFNGQLSFTWPNAPQSGVWKVTTVIETKTGDTVPGGAMTITVQ